MANQQPKTIQEQIEIPGYLRISKIIIWTFYIFIVIGIVALFLRVILLALSANPNTGFTELVANISRDYLQPFRGIFPPRQVGETGYLDVSAMFAIIVYLFIAWGLNSLVDYVQGKIDISKAEQKEKLLELRARAMRSEALAAKNQSSKKTPRVVK